MKNHSYCAPSAPSGLCLECERERLTEELRQAHLQVKNLQECHETGNRLLVDRVERIESLNKELDAAHLQVRELIELLMKRRVMEPKHSREDHECDECTVLGELGRSRDGFVQKRKCAVDDHDWKSIPITLENWDAECRKCGDRKET